MVNELNNTMLKFITCGSVDDGKSTLIGRLLYDTNSIFTDQLETLKNDSKKYGTQNQKIDYALLTDGLLSERAQGITIDVAYRYFDTKNRKFIIADTPGHEQYTRNMATATSSADVAIILVDALKGISIQTKRHLYITTLFGIKDVVVAINKMDLVDFSEDTFNTIKEEFLSIIKSFNLENINIKFVPVCSLTGDNIVLKSLNTPWYEDKTPINILETINPNNLSNNTFRFPIQYINRPNSGFRGYCGTIANGTVKVGDKIKITPSNKITTIKEIVTFDKNLQTAKKDESITLTLNDEIDINRGDIIIKADDNIPLSDNFKATIVWMDEIPLNQNNSYELKIATLNTNAKITLNTIKDLTTLKDIEVDTLNLNEIATCNIQLDKKVLIDTFKENKTTGSFILIDKITNKTVASGIVTQINQNSKNLFTHHHTITKELREKNLNQKPFILWFTGLSASGKSTLANEVEKALFNKELKTYLLDGDNLRNGLNSDLAFSLDDREENIRRVAHLSQLMLDAGLIVITAFISPFKKDREFARSLVKDDEFIEIFVDTSLETCELRDKKGLYQKAKKGEIKDFTGINSPYEKPTNANIIIKDKTVEQSVEQILDYLEGRN
jgi:bifunctional enzyme CysN/CysC